MMVVGTLKIVLGLVIGLSTTVEDFCEHRIAKRVDDDLSQHANGQSSEMKHKCSVSYRVVGLVEYKMRIEEKCDAEFELFLTGKTRKPVVTDDSHLNRYAPR